MKKTTNIAFCALAALCLGGNAYAGSWSARGDFSLAANPNGVWSYGSESTLGAFSAYSTTSRDGGCGNSNVAAWSYDVNLPFVMANDSGTDQICAGYITIPIDVLHMHPGGDGSYSVTRWTAPESGIFEITGFFEGLNARFRLRPPRPERHGNLRCQYPQCQHPDQLRRRCDDERGRYP